MVRGSGKFKTKRGGGRNFSKNFTLDENGTAVSMDRRRGKKQEDEEDSDEEEDEGESEEESEEEGTEVGASRPAQPELSRAERRELKKKEKKVDEEEEDEDLINPNHITKKLNISDLGAPRELSRREREQKEKKEAQERYWKLHVQGKTDQAKTDLARLAKIREERVEAQAKRKAVAEAKAAEIEAKRAAQKTGKRE